MRRGPILRTVVSLFFITLLYFSFQGEMGQMVQVLKAIQPHYFLLGLLLHLLVMGMISTRLKLVFNAQGLRLPLTETLRLSFLGIFFNNFLPTAAGGDVPKAYYAYKKTQKKMVSFACVLGDRLVGLFALISMALIGIFILWTELTVPIKIAVTGLFLMALFGISFLVSERMSHLFSFILKPLMRFGAKRILKMQQVLQTMNKNRKCLFQAFTVSIIGHTFSVLSMFVLILGLSLQESFIRLFVILPLVIVLSMLPSLNGLGIRESAFVFFLGGSMGKSGALALAILWLVFLGIDSLIGGIYYLTQGWQHIPLKDIKKIEQNLEEELP